MEDGVVAWRTRGSCFGKRNALVSAEKCLFIIWNFFRSVNDLLSGITSQKFSKMQCFLSSLYFTHSLCTFIVIGGEGTTFPKFCLWEKRNYTAAWWMLLRKYKSYFIIQSNTFSRNGRYETTYLNKHQFLICQPHNKFAKLKAFFLCSYRKFDNIRGSS